MTAAWGRMAGLIQEREEAEPTPAIVVDACMTQIALNWAVEGAVFLGGPAFKG